MQAVLAPNPDAHPEWFTNRELSWLEFNRRVLEEAQDPTNPILERVKFLAIVDSNLAEFYEVRVAGLRQQAEAGVSDRKPDGLSPEEQLAAIDRAVRAMVAEQYAAGATRSCRPREGGLPHRAPGRALEARCGLAREPLRDRDLSGADADRDRSRPSLPAHPEQESLDRGAAGHRGSAGALSPRRGAGAARAAAHHPPARQAGPSRLRLPARCAPLAAADALPGVPIVDHTAFRVTRNSNLYVDDEEIENLLTAVEQELRRRRRGEAVRLEVREPAGTQIEQALLNVFELERSISSSATAR